MMIVRAMSIAGKLGIRWVGSITMKQRAVRRFEFQLLSMGIPAKSVRALTDDYRNMASLNPVTYVRPAFSRRAGTKRSHRVSH